MPEVVQKKVGNRWVADKFLGYVLFSQTQLDAGTVSHEGVHMALGYMRRARQTVKLRSYVDDHEEVLAYHIGNMTNQLNDHFHEYGCYR